MKEINFGESITDIYSSAFSYCSKLERVTLPDHLQAIHGSVFFACENMTEVDFGRGIKALTDRSFCFCRKLSQVVIPDNIVTIERQAFWSCDSLRSVVIGRNVETIGFQAFLYDPKLAEVTCLAKTPPVIETRDVFTDQNYANVTLKVPAASLNAYRNAEFWSLFTNIVAMSAETGDVNGDGIVSISDVTSMIDLLLSNGDYDLDSADVNGDGQFTISDVSALIDSLLAGN